MTSPQRLVTDHLPNLDHWYVQDIWTRKRRRYAWLSIRVLDILAGIRPA